MPGLIDETATMGNILTIRDCGLKIKFDEALASGAGVYFKPETGLPQKVSVIAVNESRTLKVLVPETLTEETAYSLAIFTQSSTRGHNHLLKDMRDMRSDFTLTAQK